MLAPLQRCIEIYKCHIPMTALRVPLIADDVTITPPILTLSPK